jgi:hypothetical protein
MFVANLYNRLDELIGGLTPTPGREVHSLDYAHMVGGVLYHGTLSDLDGEVRSTWTYEESGEVVRRDRPLDRKTFEWLWGGVGALPVFHRNLCNDMGRAIDPTAHHVVSLVFTEGGEFGRCVCLVPADEADEAFGQWLRMLGRPDTGRD